MKILEFSGGKDSIACLTLLKDELSDITVLWADSGDSFPETLQQMEKVRNICPNFEIVKGNQPKVINENGYPVDVLPVRNYGIVQYHAQQDRPKLQGFLECCYNSFLIPMHNKAIELGATEIIRGQKLADNHKNPLKDGDVIDGITYRFPLQDWTDDRVMELVKDSDLLPSHYSGARTSLDCMHCTAYLADNQWKLPYLEKYHPKQGKEVRRRLEIIKSEVMSDMAYFAVLED